ncbi:MAG TPA: HPF/RaiA family ribosome-associated protein [Terriglobales bacterium]|nr:HPF/RaiA family ribosome-associated protein [Terriglobales bacterium]
MNVQVSYKVPKSPDLERQINQNIEKLNRRLQVFRSDLVHFHAIVDEQTARAGFDVRLDLRLPSGDIASRDQAKQVDAAIRGAFQDLLEQVGKHKDRLRAQHQWPNRRRAGKPREVTGVPFEETLAAVQPLAASDKDISDYVDVSLPRMQRFVEREMRFRENNGELRPYQLSTREVISEAIANALGRDDKPEKLAIEPWLYGLALRAMHNLAGRSDDGASVHLEDAARGRETYLGQASDEPILQFHQPDESVTEENIIPNVGVATPEDAAASDEMIRMIETALRGTLPEDREAFLLFGIEGFTVEEISAISGRGGEAVRGSIKAAREHLQKHLPVSGTIKDKLLQNTKIA